MRNKDVNFFMKTLCVFALAVFAVVLTAVAALAADFPVPQADIAQVLLNFATNYKALGTLGILSALTLISVQVVKQFAPDQWQYKRLMTLICAIAYSVISGLMVPGSNAATVVITVFLTSGGAVALYEGLKGVGLIKSA
jgi:hypothetical protein